MRERGVCGSSAAAGVIPGTTKDKDKDRGGGEDGVARRRRWGIWSVKGGERGNGGRRGSAKDPIAGARWRVEPSPRAGAAQCPTQPRHHASDDAIQRPDNTRTRLTPPAYFSYLWRIVLQLFQIAHQAKHRRRRGSALFLRSAPAPAAAPGTAHRRVGRLALRHFLLRRNKTLFPKSIWSLDLPARCF